MPGKYSHNVVLSQYSSQGIISLPNGQQLDYFKQAAPPRAVPTLTSLQRTPSNATKSSEQDSVASKSIRSVAETPKPRRYDLILKEDNTPRRRLVIAESDSEGEAIASEYILAKRNLPNAPETLGRSPGHTSTHRLGTLQLPKQSSVKPTHKRNPILNRISAKCRGAHVASLCRKL